VNLIIALKQHLLLAVGSDWHLNTIDESAMFAVVHEENVFQTVEDSEMRSTHALVNEVAIRVLAKSVLRFAQVNCEHVQILFITGVTRPGFINVPFFCSQNFTWFL
jgi:hypothetical protein